MSDKFFVTPKGEEENKDKYVIMSLRIKKDLKNEYDKLAEQSEHSRNALMCMALKYALEHIEFIPEK